MAKTARGQAQLAAEFGRRVHAARSAHGLSQEALAQAAGVHRTYVGHIERGETSPTLANLVRIAVALGVDPGDLVRGMALSSE